MFIKVDPIIRLIDASLRETSIEDRKDLLFESNILVSLMYIPSLKE